MLLKSHFEVLTSYIDYKFALSPSWNMLNRIHLIISKPKPSFHRIFSPAVCYNLFGDCHAELVEALPPKKDFHVHQVYFSKFGISMKKLKPQTRSTIPLTLST